MLTVMACLMNLICMITSAVSHPYFGEEHGQYVRHMHILYKK